MSACPKRGLYNTRFDERKGKNYIPVTVIEKPVERQISNADRLDVDKPANHPFYSRNRAKWRNGPSGRIDLFNPSLSTLVYYIVIT